MWTVVLITFIVSGVSTGGHSGTLFRPRRSLGVEAGKRRLAGDTARAATTDEVKQLRREAQDLKEVVAEQALELHRQHIPVQR